MDRKTGYLWLKKCRTRKSQAVCVAPVHLLDSIKKELQTIIADNGKELNLHEQIADELGIEFYFADPYSAWQKGTNENTNGLNHSPRKRLGFKIPSQILLQKHGVTLQMLI